MLPTIEMCVVLSKLRKQLNNWYLLVSTISADVFVRQSEQNDLFGNTAGADATTATPTASGRPTEHSNPIFPCLNVSVMYANRDDTFQFN